MKRRQLVAALANCWPGPDGIVGASSSPRVPLSAVCPASVEFVADDAFVSNRFLVLRGWEGVIKGEAVEARMQPHLQSSKRTTKAIVR